MLAETAATIWSLLVRMLSSLYWGIYSVTRIERCLAPHSAFLHVGALVLAG